MEHSREADRRALLMRLREGISVAVARLGADLQAGAGRLWRPG